MFNPAKKESYHYETLGGNNSRAAVQELYKENKDVPTFRTRLVSVYSGLTDDQALILASKHNKTTAFHHQMSTLEKVSYCNIIYKCVCVDPMCGCMLYIICMHVHGDCVYVSIMHAHTCVYANLREST